MAPSVSMVLCLLVAVQAAATAQGCCCFPSIFEATLAFAEGSVGPGGTPGENDHVETGMGEPVLVESTIHVNFIIGRITLFEHLYTGEGALDFTMVEDLKANDMYIIIRGRRQCFKTPLPALFAQGRCVLEKMNKTGTQRLGLGTESLNVDVYEHVDNDTTAKFYVTPEHCLPVFQALVIPISGSSVAQGQLWSDIHLGAKDPSVYEIPDFCEGATEPPNGDTEISEAVARHMRRRGVQAW